MTCMMVMTMIIIELTSVKATGDSYERLRCQTRSPDEKAADFSRHRQRRGIVGLDAATVEDPEPISRGLPEPGREYLANSAMHPPPAGPPRGFVGVRAA